ncbi:MAG: DUF4920 domain-containing protein [Candidatus Binatia bacterium]|nr:DUF4920 domain-containing protein [Candidatus Binatia bacterium]
MKTLTGLFTATLLTVFAVAAPAQDFGATLQLVDETPLPQVVQQAAELGKKPVLVRGTVADVCQRKGCWTVLQSGETHVRVRFKDYGFFVPTDCSGRQALVEGVVEVKTLSEDMARHYEEEARNGSPGEVDGPRQEVSMIATGVRLLPIRYEAPAAP